MSVGTMHENPLETLYKISANREIRENKSNGLVLPL